MGHLGFYSSRFAGAPCQHVNFHQVAAPKNGSMSTIPRNSKMLFIKKNNEFPSKRRTSNGSTFHSISACNSIVKSAKATSIVQLCLRYPCLHNYRKSRCFHVVNQISMGHVQCQTVSLPGRVNPPRRRSQHPVDFAHWSHHLPAGLHRYFAGHDETAASKNVLAPRVLRWLHCGDDESVNRLVWFSWGK